MLFLSTYLTITTITSLRVKKCQIKILHAIPTSCYYYYYYLRLTYAAKNKCHVFKKFYLIIICIRHQLNITSWDFDVVRLRHRSLNALTFIYTIWNRSLITSSLFRVQHNGHQLEMTNGWFCNIEIHGKDSFELKRSMVLLCPSIYSKEIHGPRPSRTCRDPGGRVGHAMHAGTGPSRLRIGPKSPLTKCTERLRVHFPCCRPIGPLCHRAWKKPQPGGGRIHKVNFSWFFIT